MKKMSIVVVMICVISFAASIVLADSRVERMPTKTNSIYEESVPAMSAEVTTVRNRVLVEEVNINNYIEKAPSKTPGADLVQNTEVIPNVSDRLPVGGITFADGTTAEFYSTEEYNNFLANNIENIQGATSIYINDLTSGSYMGSIPNDYSSGSIAGYGSSISVSYDSYITQVGEDIIIAPLAQYEGSISNYFDQGQISVGAGNTISVSSTIGITDPLPIATLEYKDAHKREGLNKNVRDKMDKRNKEIRGRIDEI